MEEAGDAAGGLVQFDADEPHSCRGHAYEVADSAAGFQNERVCRDTEPGDAVVDGGDDGRRRVKGVERGALRALVLGWRERSLQFIAQGLPGGVLVVAGCGVGKYRQGDGTKAGEAGKCFLFGRRCRPRIVLDSVCRPDGVENVAGLLLFAAGDKYSGR
jgi:hypothetical protein